MKWFRAGQGGTRVEGLGFFEKDGVFRRLMLDLPAPIPDDVEKLTWNTAGVQLRFRGTFSEIHIRVELLSPPKFTHMTTIGESGFDMYLKTDGDADPVYCSSSYIPDKTGTGYEATMWSGGKIKAGVTLNFPLYNGIKSFEIGFDDDAEILPPEPHKNGRILVYGGSIDQGCAAQRPGMAYSNILSRWMDREFINLGFSGAGRAEDEVALALREIPGVTAFVINTAGNCFSRSHLAERFPSFISLIRERYPDTPMLIYSLPRWTCDRFGSDPETSNEGKAEELEKLFRELAARDRHVYFMRSEGGGEPFDGHPMEYEHTVDGFHPNDFGFALMARELYFKLNEISAAEKKI